MNKICLFAYRLSATSGWKTKLTENLKSSLSTDHKLSLNVFERPACLATLKSSDRTKQSVCGWQYIYIYHIVRLARISLTLSLQVSLSFIASGRSSGLHSVSSHSCCMYVRAGRPALIGHMRGSTGVHHLRARPCFSSSVRHVWFV